MDSIVFLERDSIRARARRPVFPHVWTSGTAMQALADPLIDDIEAFARGEEGNRVT